MIAVYDDAATHGCGSSTFAMPSPSLSSSAFSGSLSPSPPTHPSSTDFGMPSLSASVTTVKVTVSVAAACVLPGVVRVAVYWPAGQPPLGGCRSRIGPVPPRVIPGPASDHCSCAPDSSPSAFRIDPRSAMSPYWSTVMPWRTLEIAATSGFSPLLDRLRSGRSEAGAGESVHHDRLQRAVRRRERRVVVRRPARRRLVDGIRSEADRDDLLGLARAAVEVEVERRIPGVVVRRRDLDRLLALRQRLALGDRRAVRELGGVVRGQTCQGRRDDVVDFEPTHCLAEGRGSTGGGHRREGDE